MGRSSPFNVFRTLLVCSIIVHGARHAQCYEHYCYSSDTERTQTTHFGSKTSYRSVIAARLNATNCLVPSEYSANKVATTLVLSHIYRCVAYLLKVTQHVAPPNCGYMSDMAPGYRTIERKTNYPLSVCYATRYLPIMIKVWFQMLTPYVTMTCAYFEIGNGTGTQASMR